MSIPRFSVRNEVLVNVLMFVISAGGCLAALTLTREMFPESRPDQISVTSIYPGVQPAEIEKAVTIKIEESLRDVDGVDKIDSVVREGMTSTILTLLPDVDNIDAVIQEVKTQVDSVQDLPDDVESTVVRKMQPRLPVIAVAIYGRGDESALKDAARQLRDELLKLPGITDVDLGGIRDDEISVEVKPEKLYEFNVTFEEVAAAIRQTNIDISSGQIKGTRSTVSIRTLGEQQRGVDLEDIVVRTDPNGRRIHVRDVAIVRDEFIESDVESWFNSERSVNCVVYKVGDQDIVQIADMVKAYVRGKQGVPFDGYGFAAAMDAPWYQQPFALMGASLAKVAAVFGGKADVQKIYDESRATPFAHAFKVELHTDLSRFIEGRLDLMIRNGQSGLILVVISLLVFLNWRIAFWTAMGLPVSFLGTFAVMYLMGISLNLISLFGLIIVLGIIVDDAIVIAENIYRHVQEGMPPHQAAIRGAEEVMAPVTIAVLTTIAAFVPMMFLGGRLGEFFRQLPLVIMAALSVSLLEALIILPAHLAHLPAKMAAGAKAATAPVPVSRRRRLMQFAGSLFSHSGISAMYSRFLQLALTWRYVTVGLAIALLLTTLGLPLGGVVPFTFIQKMDSETITGALEMPMGTPVEVTRERLRELSDKALSIPEIVNVQVQVAVQLRLGAAGAEGATTSSHLGQLIIELKAADEREVSGERSSEDVLAELRNFASELPGVNSVVWESLSGGPGGRDMEIRVGGPNFDDVIAVAEELKARLNSYAGVVDLDDNMDRGQREMQLRVREAARPAGITVGALGDHVRSAMYGKEARRITRDREDVRIMVRYSEDFRESVYNVESMWIPLPAAAALGAERPWAPLRELASFEETQEFGSLNRSQQARSVKVFADVQEGGDTSGIVAQLQREFDQEIRPKYPAVSLIFQGNVEENARSFDSLKIAMPVALMLIYLMIAGLFRSYVQPVVVMLVIPFALVGAILGHWLLGYPLTFISAIGMLALMGIVVNDSIVLVDYVNRRIREGSDPFTANLEGSRTRLRAIFLTSETTIAGLLPMLFETSFQAKFLIPMAITICFGLLFSTVLTLVVLPSINMIFFDVLGLLGLRPINEEDDSDETATAGDRSLVSL